MHKGGDLCLVRSLLDDLFLWNNRMIHVMSMLLGACVENNVVSTQQHRPALDSQPLMRNLSSSMKCLTLHGTFSHTSPYFLFLFQSKTGVERASVCLCVCVNSLEYKPSATGNTTRPLQRWNFLPLRCISLLFYCSSGGKGRKESCHSLFKKESHTMLPAGSLYQSTISHSIQGHSTSCEIIKSPELLHILSSYNNKFQFI